MTEGSGEAYSIGSCPSSSVVIVCQHFNTTSSLKLLSRLCTDFIRSIVSLGWGMEKCLFFFFFFYEKLALQFGSYGNLDFPFIYNGEIEIGIYCQAFADYFNTFIKMFLEKACIGLSAT